MPIHRPRTGAGGPLRRTVPVALIAAAALLAGCSTTAERPSASAGTGTAAQDGGTLRYVIAGSPATAGNDPHGGLANESDALRFALLYDVLTVPGDDGRAKPRLAESWQPDSTLTRWTLRLRTGATFTDGRPVRAADVLYSLRRIERKAAENYGRLAQFDTQASTAPDDHTVVLVSRAPNALVPEALESVTFVVPEGSDDFTKPVPGSGPYLLDSMDGQTAVVKRNPGWWGERPRLDAIEIRAVADPQARAAAVAAGQADVAGSVNPAAAKSSGAGVRVVRRPAVTEYPFVMRLDRKPFDDPRVREAFKLATDRQALVDTVFLGFGRIANDLPTPYDPSYPKDLAQRPRDLDRAKKLLAEAGHADGLRVTLHTTTSYPGMDTAAALYARQLADIGVTVTVSNDPPDTYFTTVWGKADFYTGYFGGIPFTDVARVALMSASPTNETAWKRPAWDAAFTEALAVGDDATRNERLGALQKELWKDGGYVVWGLGDGLDLTSPSVRGLPTGPGFQRLFLDTVRLAAPGATG
ncbi:ABC transporter substrate-binding protein [Microbispora sp. NEAU-D428]|uniref:ABC transporter substrate-binding protein n=1 Tax=Microbispora sitophila TaxID=2771537 RepID=UPI001865E65B|nr:ABC transporter substrate-binding protein [Microbispora sitophila]MBE3013999.1 ABC transporter substrate-binding protein [Microbispora sitophila]